ncbi:MAG: hypothetical protein GYB55_19115 [Cytophagales bacterium]|uniref:hypothetical protein n=1 Tax=Cyclobacterium marinum TaxID=104 RepID=UPI0003039A11|nr:hypothetical protein [Cyclobacterium marinum]MBI0399323.1 hypothetical protein [Cyclobacterium marinum]MBR9777012.1 hypothetical protein [Cytophagales bacterium]
MGKPKTEEFACVRVALNFRRKDTQRWGFFVTFLIPIRFTARDMHYSKKVTTVIINELV